MFGTFRWYNNCPKMFNKSQNGFIRKFANKRTDTANPAMKRTKIKISDGIYPIHVFILLFVCAPFVAGQNYQDCEVNGVYKACSAQPQILDFSRSQNNYSIRVDPPNYTCGTPSAPFYRLGDSIDKRQVCDASDEALKHPVEYMVDKNDASWWQSITWPLNDFDTSSRFKINITLSFNKVYQLTGDMTITFNSGRPSQMILEKSTDYGKTWTALQYYARSCETTFKDVPRVIPSTKLDEVICVSKFSGPSSSNIPGQQVKFEVYQDRLKIFTGSLGTNYTNLYNNIDGTNLVNFLTFTNLRIRLLYPATDAREFSRNFFDFLHYYYAISSISIMTECFCNLHGASCLFDDIGIKCACKHNTDGRECERCLPLYNNRPWKAGLYAPFPSGTANECQKCECNDHAESCVYNATLTKGVCQNCTNNTRGDQCELCVEGFFPNTSLPLNHTERCVECSCESLGVMNVNSSCIQEATNGKNPGQCDCKPLVTGLRCEYCQPEYYGLLIPDNNPGTCKECNCDTDGTVNNSKVCNQADGQCPCKPSTGNRRCDICKEGYFQFPKNNPSKGCLECGCDPGTSVTKSCDKTSGKCTCKDHVSGDKCSDIDKNFYVPAWDELVLQPLGAPSLDCTLDDDLWTEERPFDGNEFATCPLAKDVTLKFASVPVNRTQKGIEWPFHVGIRYSLSTPDALEGAVVVVEAEGTSGYDVSKMASQKNTSIDSACPVANGQVANITIEILPGVSSASVVINETVSLDLRCKYTLSLKFPGKINSTDNITIDSALLIPALTKMNSSVVMDSLRAYNESTNQAETLQTYNTCVGEMSGLLVRNTTMYKDNCRSLLRAVGGELNNEVTSCGCSTTGSIVGTVCDPIGGQCNCKSGVGGRKCDRCLSGYYNFTLNGCERCPMRICPIITTTTPLPVTSSSTAKDSSALVMVEQNFLGIYLGIGVGILLIPLIILICYCCTKRRQKVSLNDDTVPRKNVNRYEFNENLAMGNRKAKKQVGFNDRLSLVGSPSVRVNQFGWTQHDTDDTGDLDSIPEETSSAEDDDVILPYYYNSIPKPSNVRNAKTVNVDAAAVKVDNKHANMPGTANGSVPSTHFNTFKGETPISVPEMYMDTKREKPPEKPKRKNLAKKQEENTMPPLRASKVNLKSKTMEYVYPNDYPPQTSSKSERVSRENPAFNQALGPQLRANRPHEKPPRTPSRKIDLFNKGMDANHPKEELLPSSNKIHLYADYGEFDEVNGSLV